MTKVTLLYILVPLAVVLMAEALFLLFADAKSNRDRVNRRMRLSADTENRADVLVSIRKERGLGAGGEFRLGFTWLAELVTQSGVTLGLGRLAAAAAASGVLSGIGMLVWSGSPAKAAAALVAGGIVLPILVLKILRGRRQKLFSIQLPEAIELIVRSLKAGHPVPVAIGLVGREMADPIGTEFGIVADEVTYGSDLVSALRRLQARVGQADLPLFITAVSIQATSGGNLREILQGLSGVIRDRIKMRRKIKAISAEGRASAYFLTAMPFLLVAAISMITPDYYGAVWGERLTNIGLAGAGGWLLMGNIVMRRMISFRF